MKNKDVKLKILFPILAIGGLLLAIMLSNSRATAQVVDLLWTQPYQLSTEAGRAETQEMITDQFGYLHLFWSETEIIEGRAILMYSRFDGENWTTPVDLYVTETQDIIGNITAATDSEGVLHLLFSYANFGFVYYTNVSIQEATSVQDWQKPERLDITMGEVVLRVDSNGVLHLLYTSFDEAEPGVYYTSYESDGQSWSESIWLDADIPVDLTPIMIQFEIDEEDSLHAVWNYSDQNMVGQWVRYANSLDQDQHWSTPFTIDRIDPGSDALRIPFPALAVEGETVHIIWAADRAGGSLPYRKHRISYDSGLTWDQAGFIFGDLHGQALGDGVAFDASGRLHFLGQIRYPQGIYHAYWDQGRWSQPSMVYLIAEDSLDDIGGRIHAHRIQVSIRAGNQLVVTFTTSPGDPRGELYAMQTTLRGVSDLPVQSLPTYTHTPTPDSGSDLVSATPMPTEQTEEPGSAVTVQTHPPRVNSPTTGLVIGIALVVVFVVGFITIRWFIRRHA